ncbi:hypothetical protein ACTPOK_01670 [Streptomyces inhibens]|uniref:hypothetical protein n=1 Tax=Streptomyces inhibens TaxID=2293571 RepID=UPI00402A8D5C
MSGSSLVVGGLGNSLRKSACQGLTLYQALDLLQRLLATWTGMLPRSFCTYQQVQMHSPW